MPTMRYKRLNNFPPELMTLLKDRWNDIQTEKYDDIPCVEPSLKMIVCKSLNSRFQPHFKAKIQGIVFAISDKDLHIAKIHTDKSRHTTMNVPIQVDHVGSFICGKSTNLSVYQTPKQQVIDGKTSNEYPWETAMYEFVSMETPLIINTKVPHSWCGNEDSDRVIASFMFEDELKPKELINSTPSDWF